MSKTEVDNAKASYLSAEAQLAAAKADYELAKVNYDYTVIQAPISGIVGNVSLTKGDYVSPSGQPLLSIIQYNPIRVVFSITDKDYLEEIGKGGLFAGEKSGSAWLTAAFSNSRALIVSPTTRSIAVPTPSPFTPILPMRTKL